MKASQKKTFPVIGCITIAASLVIIFIIVYFVIREARRHVEEHTTDTSSVTAKQTEKLDCDSGLWEHVYNKKRLKVIEECKIVTGTILRSKKEEDGDLHIQLKPDAGQESLLNDKNYEIQKGALVVEPICINEVIQKNAKLPCQGYINNVFIPGRGDHVSVKGSYVQDMEHGWMEIHPVTEIKLLK
jgi:preprotein translocase subunit YajC